MLQRMTFVGFFMDVALARKSPVFLDKPQYTGRVIPLRNE